MFSCEVSFPLGCIDIFIDASTDPLEDGPLVLVSTGNEETGYVGLLLLANDVPGEVDLHKGHRFAYTRAGRMQFFATAGTLSYVVNASADEREKFVRTLSEICNRLESEVGIGGDRGYAN